MDKNKRVFKDFIGDGSLEGIVIKYPSAYIWIWKSFIIISIICFVVISVIDSEEAKSKVLIFLVVIIIASLIGWITYRRYQIIFRNNGMEITPMIGRAKMILYQDISDVKTGRGESIVFMQQDKALIKISSVMSGYDDILKALGMKKPGEERFL